MDMKFAIAFIVDCDGCFAICIRVFNTNIPTSSPSFQVGEKLKGSCDEAGVD
jgi:hypothetical protein